MKLNTSLIAVLITLTVLGQVRLETCNSGDFIVSNGIKEYLRINDNGVYGCNQKNMCDMLQLLSLSSDGVTLSISNGNFVNLPDSSNTNEIQNLALSSEGILSLTQANSVQLPDASSQNELQQLSLKNGELSISSGNSVELPDASATNEIQSLDLSGSTLTISSSNSVDLRDRTHYVFTLTTPSWSTPGTWKQFQFSTIESNSFGSSALNLTTFTAPFDGWYRFTFTSCLSLSTSSDGRTWVSFRLAGVESSASPALHGGTYIPDTGNFRAVTATLTRRVSAGQSVDVYVYTPVAGTFGVSSFDYAKVIWTGEYMGK